MENQQMGDYFGPFATTLRKLMDENPRTNEKTSPAELAEILGTSTQTVSYYVNGKRKPSYDNIVAMTEFFNVSADYLLFGIEANNRTLNEQTGLTNDAIKMLQCAHASNKYPNTVDISELLSSLLSDRDFYVFMEDVIYHAGNIKELEDMNPVEREKKYPGINIAGYFKWDLIQEINNFIFSQLEKHGLKIKRE
jgi:transcriptional regulator with XRE-family HTH domain